MLPLGLSLLPRSIQRLLDQPPDTALPESTVPPEPTVPSPRPSVSTRVLQIFSTDRNAFGLFRVYHSDRKPSHDPEECIDLQDLSDSPAATGNAVPLEVPQPAESSFYPYPNESSFRLGEWYWNGAQKSRESFRELLSIIGDPEFRPADLKQVQWGKIDANLAQNDFDKERETDKKDLEWIDEDAGWKKTPVKISVPFHKRAKDPGPQDYHVGHLYHRSLVSVIREKLANPDHAQRFHYQPFKLFWQPTNTSQEIRVHGELYTSAAFLDANREVQEMPGEPGCKLERVVIAMMFWSDATHLTTFGTAKLWPCYLFFGNESKYRRCKPNCHLCSHVAYFQAVRGYFATYFPYLLF